MAAFGDDISCLFDSSLGSISVLLFFLCLVCSIGSSIMSNSPLPLRVLVLAIAPGGLRVVIGDTCPWFCRGKELRASGDRAEESMLGDRASESSGDLDIGVYFGLG